MYSFVRPLGGMFVWVRFDFTTHPLADDVPHARLSQALWVFWTQKPYLCLVAPGSMFAPTQEIREQDAYNCVRLCFAACPAEDVKPISKRFVDGAQAFWRIRKKSTIDKLLEEDDFSKDPRFNFTQAELEKKGVKDFQLDYALRTLKRLRAPANVASAESPKRS